MILGYCILLAVSYLEHILSVRPSTLLSLYLGTSILLDLPRVRTLFFISERQIVAQLFLANFFIKILLFALEISEKRRLLSRTYQAASPEATSGVINRALFLWLNNLFLKGFRTLLTIDTLTPLDAELLDESKAWKLIENWGLSKSITPCFSNPLRPKRSYILEANKSSEHTLFWNFLMHYKWSFLAGVLPRLAYTGFSFSQPFLVQRVLDFTTEPTDVSTKNNAYALVVAYAVVYIGLSVSYDGI
jgi:hypothetical protein